MFVYICIELVSSVSIKRLRADETRKKRVYAAYFCAKPSFILVASIKRCKISAIEGGGGATIAGGGGGGGAGADAFVTKSISLMMTKLKKEAHIHVVSRATRK